MGGHVVIAVLVVFIMNWLSIQFATSCLTKESIPKYNTDTAVVLQGTLPRNFDFYNTSDVNDSVEDGSEVYDQEEVDDHEEDDDHEEVDDLEEVDDQEEVDDHKEVDHLETAMISTLLPCVVGKTRGIYLSQLLSTNISKLVILGCIWFLQWYVPSEHKLTSWSLNAPLVTCVDQMNDVGYVWCTERDVNTTNPNPCICGSLQSCFCGYSCTESQRGEKIR